MSNITSSDDFILLQWVDMILQCQIFRSFKSLCSHPEYTEYHSKSIVPVLKIYVRPAKNLLLSHSKLNAINKIITIILGPGLIYHTPFFHFKPGIFPETKKFCAKIKTMNEVDNVTVKNKKMKKNKNEYNNRNKNKRKILSIT